MDNLKGDVLSGLIFCLMQEKTLSVKEILLSDEADLTVVLHQLAAFYQAETMTCILPFAAEMHELGMARIINVPACLELYAAVYQGEELCIHLQGDEAIGENNGYYTVSPGKMIQGYQMRKEYVCVTISELTALVLKDLHPYMSLMLD